MKNFIFVDFDELVTNNYKGDFTGFNDEKLEALAKVIENEVVAMGKESDVEVMLITAVPENEVLGKFIEEGYKFANKVEFLNKEEGESTAAAIFNFVLNNVRDVIDYVVLGTVNEKYVRIPSDKVILVDANKTIDAESIVKKLISIRHVREMAVEKIMENVGKLKEEVLKGKKEGEAKAPEEDTKAPAANDTKAPEEDTKAPAANDTKAQANTDKTSTSKAQTSKANAAKK